MELFIWLENTAAGEWVRVSMWAFPALLTLHAIGLAFVVGVMVAIGLRVLGVAPAVPLPALRALLPVVWVAFALNLGSGLLLFIADAQMFVASGAFQIKLGLIVLGLTTVVLMRRLVLTELVQTGNRAPTRARVLACASLVCWGGAIIAGRLIAYTASPF